MKFYLLPFIFVFKLVFCAAQTDSLPKSLLWEVTGNGIKKSYIYGTIHLIDEKSFFLSNNLQKQLKKSDLLVMEINLKKEMNIMSVMSKIFMSNHMTLDSLLPPSDVNKIVEKTNQWGLPSIMIKKIKPMFLSMMREAMSIQKGENKESTKSYEIELMKIADTQNKEVDGLESVDFQLAIFDSIPYLTQAKMLLSKLDNDPSALNENEEMNAMLETYKLQDVDKLCNTENTSTQEDDVMINNFLLIKRNTAWIPKMTSFMKQKSTFFAVGAGHLGGRNGVIRLLKANGYTVTPLINK